MAKLYYCLVLVLFSVLPGPLKAQEDSIPKDSAGFRDFLLLQTEVPGLGYRFFIKGKRLPEVFAGDSIYLFSQLDSGYESRVFTDFSKERELEVPLIKDSLAYRFEYAVLSKTASFDASRDFVVERARSGDYLIKNGDVAPSEDFVSLASKSPYSPTQKFKLKFITDYRLFGVVATIVFFFFVASVMITHLLIMKVRKNKLENLKKEYEEVIIEPLTSLLFEKELDELEKMDPIEIKSLFDKNLLMKPQYQHVLIDSIITLNKKMKGEFKEKLKTLYKKLELDKISIAMLQHKKWDRTTMALVHINEMDLVEAIPQVRKFTNSKNFHIRSTAVSTLLNLSERVDLVFLRDQAYPISLWQQMNYLRIIRFVSSQKDLKLEVLFDSKNQSIRIFGIKLVRILGRVDLIEVLARSAENVPDEEKIEILETYATLGAYMETRFINDCLKSSNYNLSLAAAKAAGAVGDSDSVEILIGLIHSETVFRRKLSYLKGLYALDKERFEDLTSSQASPNLIEIRNHILDPMLQNV